MTFPTPGDIIIEAIGKAGAIQDAEVEEDETGEEFVVVVWSANSPEQIEAALHDLGWELKPVAPPAP